MKYIKKFENHSAYESAESGLILPNVSLCVNEDEVHYKPFVETRLVAKYNVNSTSAPTQIAYDGLNNKHYMTGFTSIEVDGVAQPSVVSGYTFDTLGEHTVKYTLESQSRVSDYALYHCPRLINVEIPNGVTQINERAFAQNNLLQSISLPDNLASIGAYAFYMCKSLININIPTSVTSIDMAAFMDCSGLTSVVIPSGVTSISTGAFSGCTSLTSVTIPDSATSIGNSAFEKCNGLTSINIPSGVTKIDNSAFKNCSGLTSINIPSGVTSIGYSAFQGCKSLTSIDIPSGVTSIGNAAFSGCTSLTSITVKSATPPTLGSNANTFNSTNNCPIYVPSVSVDAYKAADKWSSLASRIQAIP